MEKDKKKTPKLEKGKPSKGQRRWLKTRHRVRQNLLR